MEHTHARECERIIIEAFERQYDLLHQRACALISEIRDDQLYQSPNAVAPSLGESVLRSVASVERTFGGITANLWDDPFEWTLPENLSTAKRVIEYLEEVQATRRRSFGSFGCDCDLSKQIMLPSGVAQPLVVLLLDTLVTATQFLGKAEP